MMKRNYLLSTLAAATLGLAALMAAGCTDDDRPGEIPAGAVPLSIGSVSIAGAETAGNTRAAINEDIDGFTGIRKSSFVPRDELKLTLTNDGSTTTTEITAIRRLSAWELDASGYVIPSTTEISATYTPAEVVAGIKPDVLVSDPNYRLDGQKVTFTMKHANAMIDITLPAGTTATDITLAANNGTDDEILTTTEEEEAGGSMHHRTIAAPGTVKSISATFKGQSYVALLSPALTVEANKRYPISLTFKEDKLIATVGTTGLDWGEGDYTDVIPAGYTHIIASPEDLAQIGSEFGLEADASVKVLQTADIDMAQLMTADEANRLRPGKNYTYSRTAGDDWTSMCAMNDFGGTYNGNGHTISNLKGHALFSGVSGTLTGIHLRNVNMTGAATLITAASASSVISLCSASGNVTKLGGDGSAGGLVGLAKDLAIFGCMATGTVTASGTNTGAFAGNGGSSPTIRSCYATGEVIGAAPCFSPVSTNVTYADCAYTGTQTTTISGITGGVAKENLYTAITGGAATIASVTTLHWSADNGYTLTPLTRTWYAADLWQDNAGEAPTLDMAYEGRE